MGPAHTDTCAACGVTCVLEHTCAGRHVGADLRENQPWLPPLSHSLSAVSDFPKPGPTPSMGCPGPAPAVSRPTILGPTSGSGAVMRAVQIMAGTQINHTCYTCYDVVLRGQ